MHVDIAGRSIETFATDLRSCVKVSNKRTIFGQIINIARPMLHAQISVALFSKF